MKEGEEKGGTIAPTGKKINTKRRRRGGGKRGGTDNKLKTSETSAVLEGTRAKKGKARADSRGEKGMGQRM